MTVLDQETVHELKTSWAKVDGAAVVAIFYHRVFDLAPECRGLFQGTDWAAQHVKLAGAMTAVIGSLDDVQSIVPVLHDLGRRHAQYDLSAAHYDLVGKALVWALERHLGTDFTEQTRVAWRLAYGLVSDAMQDGARRIAA